MNNLLSTVLILFCTGAFAQPKTSEEPARFVTRIPFKEYSGGVVMLKAKFGNLSDSLNFILDSGSGGASLDSTTCDEFNLPIRATDSSIAGIGGAKKVKFLFNQKLSFPNLELENINFHINDYSVLSSVYGQKIDGLLGYHFLNRYILHVNYDSSFIDVFTKGKYNYHKGGFLLKPVFTSIPMQYAYLKDARSQTQHFYFDSGAGLCLLLSKKYVSDSGLMEKKRIPIPTQAEGMTGKVSMHITIIKKMKLGPYSFHRVPVYIYDDVDNVLNYPLVSGLIGSELLRRFNIVYNYQMREIHLTPNKNFKAIFDYSYTGMSIYQTNGRIIIEEVIDGSPAAVCGFKTGDEIIGVDKNFSGNIIAYKDLINVENTSAPILIRRAGKYEFITLKTGNIVSYGKKMKRLLEKK